MTEEIKGYSLFNDIEDSALRIRNRAVVMANMAEQYTRNKKISPKGAHLILSYFSAIKKEERAATEQEFSQRMKERGFAV